MSNCQRNPNDENEGMGRLGNSIRNTGCLFSVIHVFACCVLLMLAAFWGSPVFAMAIVAVILPIPLLAFALGFEDPPAILAIINSLLYGFVGAWVYVTFKRKSRLRRDSSAEPEAKVEWMKTGDEQAQQNDPLQDFRCVSISTRNMGCLFSGIHFLVCYLLVFLSMGFSGDKIASTIITALVTALMFPVLLTGEVVGFGETFAFLTIFNSLLYGFLAVYFLRFIICRMRLRKESSTELPKAP